MTAPPFLPASPASFARRSDCLLSFDCADGMPVMRSGQALTFARASSGTFIDAQGRVMLAASHQPRVSHGGAAFDLPGLLSEPVSTNLLQQSANPTNAYYTKTNVTVTSAAVRSPDGTVIAQKLEETAINAAHSLTSPALTLGSGVYGTVSLFVRAAERSRINVALANAGNGFSCLFRIDLLTKATAVTGTGTVQDSGIQALGNSWYRVWVTGRCGAAITSGTVTISMADASDATSYLGVVLNGLNVWGLDYQEGTTTGANIWSHIPTTTAALTRQADILTVTPAFVIPDSFTVYVQFVQPLWWNHSGTVPYVALASGGSTSPRWETSLTTTSRIFTGSWYDGTTIVSATGAPTLGESMDAMTQFDSIRSLGGRVRVDVGAGLTGYSARVLPVADIGATRLTGIGDLGFAPGNGAVVLRALRMVSGLRTLDEMRGRR